MVRKLLDETGAESVNELLHLFYTTDFPRERIASYAPLVEQAAVEGDAVAREILEEAVRRLVDIALAVRLQLFPRRTRRVTAGGVFRSVHTRPLSRHRGVGEIVAGASRRSMSRLSAAVGAYPAAGLNPEAGRHDTITF
jgi:N-acetylglucosamine kinase-like BadF-type ATPase